MSSDTTCLFLGSVCPTAFLPNNYARLASSKLIPAPVTRWVSLQGGGKSYVAVFPEQEDGQRLFPFCLSVANVAGPKP